MTLVPLEHLVLPHFPDRNRINYLNQPIREDSTISNTSPMVQIASIPIIDSKNLSWEHIAELRRDNESKERLERLRKFALLNFKGKSRNEIEADLMLRIDQHQAATKKHGIKTIETALTVGISGTGMGTLIAALVGGAIPPSAAIGAIFGLGTALVKIIAARKTFEIEQVHDPIRYIVDIEETANSEKQHTV
ncbi:MAG: hypothetical protein R3E36_07855 [Nitrosomonas sp.]|nr:hypothetical protein [Nitrosomonas sp.]